MKNFSRKYLFLAMLVTTSALNAKASEQLANNLMLSDLDLDTVIIQGYRVNLLGETLSASEGVIGSEEIANRPVLRTGEILEFIPGMVVTQHSGSGKANQYFLRGFNLDHGTDFNTSIDGMPVNMRTHGHGQGYTDLNFIIPEFIQSINYHKGPYYAEVGDFSGAGSAQFNLKNKSGESIVSLTAGENNFSRLVAGGDISVTRGQLLVGFEHQTYDGPWSSISEDVAKNNLLARYSEDVLQGNFSFTLMAYKNRWNSADQIPERAVREHIIDTLGSLDTNVGGESSRYSLSSSWSNEHWSANAYAIHSSLDLFSNFTYFLDDPINGDKFEQVDERNIFGGEIVRADTRIINDKEINYKIGSDLRYDNISKVALYHTRERERLSTTREDAVKEASLGVFVQSKISVSKNLHLHLGARYDFYSADVDSNITENSGDATQGKFSFKLGASYKVSDNIETYANFGQGLHSNDARGATITQDPVSGEASEAVDLIVPSTGAEIGIKLFDAERFNISTSLWYLRSDSELVFVGDAGNTEASRASERYGNEIAAYYWLDNRWNFDLELAWTRANFTENQTREGKYVEGSVPFVTSAGISYGALTGWHGSLRYRYFGARHLDSFDTRSAQATSTTNLGIGYRWQSFSVELDALNLFDSKDHDIDYFYSSRLIGESEEGVEDLHYHPLEPRSLRIKAEYKF
ncbi:TonB-dependent receptor [Cellvibrio zantedeschiae]|uniref:TonB-dependent receptor n=1 Tax=Cellvibrio zantedeschiae TaxID=1237077 RepID=A0ABQ3BAE5_9GAMM|nr:TonB-dependent receptor [Cellvibrio zantedeschiae]GGY82789.1 TonB-dependent receptor [Cellvibrio zantedeschiae]